MPSKKHFQIGVERIVGPSLLATQLMDTVEYTCIGWQTRPRSACTDVQDDLGLFCLQIVKGPFSCAAHHLQCNFVIGIFAATSDNIPSDMSAQRRFRSACAFMRSESSLSIFWIAKDAKLITWEQQRLWSNFVAAEADLFALAQVSEYTFSTLQHNLLCVCEVYFWLNGWYFNCIYFHDYSCLQLYHFRHFHWYKC